MHQRRVVLLAVVLAACDGGGGGSTGPIDQATADDQCTAVCERELECDPEVDVEQCVEDCIGPSVGSIREDVFVDVMECRATLACDGNAEDCLSCSPTSSHQTYEAACREAAAECLEPDEVDESCEVTPDDTGELGYLCVFAPVVMDELTACFDEPDCVAIGECLQAVLGERGF
jgi:hypothetical protein